jgi:tripartite-type tricarboxylate transporter receptor subunit TctC
LVLSATPAFARAAHARHARIAHTKIAATAGAQAVPQNTFYRGKTVTLVVSSSSGGGYDIMGRTLARHLGRHIPGNPRVIVTNMPGAGGIVAMNYLYRARPRTAPSSAASRTICPSNRCSARRRRCMTQRSSIGSAPPASRSV